jgi:hypothetical protein
MVQNIAALILPKHSYGWVYFNLLVIGLSLSLAELQEALLRNYPIFSHV